MIRGFSHLQLIVRDVAVSAPWYCAALDLEQFTSGTIASGPYVGLRHRDAGFVIGMQTATPAEAEKLGAGSIEHLSFAVADRTELDATRERLAAHHIDVGEVFEEVVSYNVRLRDPDGLVLELTAPKPRTDR